MASWMGRRRVNKGGMCNVCSGEESVELFKSRSLEGMVAVVVDVIVSIVVVDGSGVVVKPLWILLE